MAAKNRGPAREQARSDADIREHHSSDPDQMKWLLQVQAELRASVEETEAIFAADETLQELTAAELEKLRCKFESGDSMALLHAIKSCAIQRIPLPLWAGYAFRRAFYSIVNGNSKSLDEAFGNPLKGQHQAARKKRWRLAHWVDFEVGERISAGESISSEMFEEIGEQLNIGRTLAMEYYYGKRKRPPS